jgi:hypothetical protein
LDLEILAVAAALVVSLGVAVVGGGWVAVAVALFACAGVAWGAGRRE